jgi:hypothetical protein
MNKKGKELGITELELAKIRRAEVDCKTAEANFRKAEAALHKFYATGPRKKKKSGRPGFWKSPDGLFFVSEVERFRKERKFKTRAITAALKQTKRWSELAKTYGTKSDPVIARAARLANQSHNELQVRYSEARRYWKFLIDPESDRREQQSLERNFDEALSAWDEAATALKNLVRTSLVRVGARNPYDFS